MSKELTIIAGPNGAGKTTFSFALIDEGLIEHFINADEIAKSLTHLNPQVRNIQAGRIFLSRLNLSIQNQKNVCFETTLSGLSYLRLIKRLKQQGWKIALYYLALESVDLSKQRVAERVNHGGHAIPIKDIERRFPKSLFNLFHYYLEEVDELYCLLNMDQPELIFTKQNATIDVLNHEHYERLKTMVGEAHE